jgi:pimeloyl-ACP methyl ester carboxylesterase
MAETTQGAAARHVSVPVWNGEITMRVRVAGQGDPVLYLHPAGGLFWDAFLERLSRSHTVYAPEHPGTTPGAEDAIGKVDSFFDLLLVYEELTRALGLRKPVLIGQSYGGMMAADLAATFPELPGRLVLLDPIGLWRDDAPIHLVAFTGSLPHELPGKLFHDPACEGARAMFTPPADPELAIKAGAAVVWALGCTGKFFWPIADHGLGKRLFRVAAPTLIVWGREDALVPVSYAEAFARAIRDSRVRIVEECGHIPQAEKPEETFDAVAAFLHSAAPSP